MDAARDSWAQLDEFMCATWISGTTVEEVVQAFNARSEDLAHPRAVTVQDEVEDGFASDLVGERLLIREVAGWVAVLEVRSSRGANDAVLTALSQGGQALNILSGERGTYLTYAVQGRITHDFDADDVGEDDLADDPSVREIREWATGLGVEVHEWTEHPRGAAFYLAEAITGTELDDSWAAGEWVGVRLPG
ncbi:DUF6461 domain-containing protein [Nonomuraea sp. NEAU-A123]|uniref:DUF6461 domain-containing protein n=1 Tax=Nonomuraea sp. NEAU-A123 TaxID=2839649 RepID=UPI001BE428AE|nr:DUF6461 domain-containing protein [Nonomuraea sp. NEAU-A123]MBT2228307.1 hypothetical protein [Nonomuraea sp. NEAU-A123]